MFCTKCGNKIKDGYIFCEKCGNRISEVGGPVGTGAGTDDTVSLVKRAKAGDEAAFHQLYDRTSKRNYYVALKMVKTDADAQDVLQDAYIRIYQHLDQFQYQGEGSFASWSSKIVSNTALNYLRKKQAVLFSDIEGDQEGEFSLEIEDEDTSRQPELAYDKKETSQIVQDLLGTLSDEQRVCAMMFYFQEESVKEIASEIGCSENTVKSRLNYARKNMMAKAEELKKKGILTGILSIAGLIAILRSKEAMAMQHVPSGVYADVSRSIASGSTASGSVAAGGSVTGSSVSGAAASSATTAGVASAGATVAAGMGIKIAAAILGVVAVITAGAAVTFMVTRNVEPASVETSSESGSSIETADGSSVSGAAAGTDEAEENEKDVFEEFVKLNTFLFNSNEEYEVKAKLEESNYGDGEKHYSVAMPLDMSFPDDVKKDLLGYAIDDYDNDGQQEMLVLGLEWEEKSGEEYSMYKTPVSVARLKVDMYENDNGELKLSDEFDDFGDVKLSAGVESWGGQFKCFTYSNNGKKIIAFQEEGSDYHARFSDGWGNWWFAALEYDDDKFKPIRSSFVDINYSGGDESFTCNDGEWMSLEDSLNYKVKELEKVGISYRFGEFMNYGNSDLNSGSIMPSDKVKQASTVLEVNNDDSKSTSFSPTQEEISSGESTISFLKFSGGNDNSNNGEEMAVFTADDCILDVGKRFRDVKDKYGWTENSGQFINAGRFWFETPDSHLTYSLSTEEKDEGFIFDDEELGWVMTDGTPVIEIRATLNELFPSLPGGKLSFDDFIDYLEENGCSSIEYDILVSAGTVYYIADINEYYASFHFDYNNNRHTLDVRLGKRKAKRIKNDAEVRLA